MKLSFRITLSLIGVLAAHAVGAADQGKPVMPEDVFPQLREVLKDSAKQSPRMMAANLAQLIADGELQQAKAGLYPTIGGYYSVTQTKDTREDVPGTLDTDKTAYNLSLTQPLFHWGERINNAKIGKIRREIADENYGEAWRLLAHEIRAAYLQMVVHKSNRANARYAKNLADENLKLAEDRLLKREVSEGAIFQTRIAADQARLSLEQAEWEFTLAKQNFAALSGSAEPGDDVVPEGIPGLAGSTMAVERQLAHFLAQAEPDTSEARIQRQQIAINDLSYRNQRTRLRPKLNLIVGVNQDEQSYTSNLAAKYGVQSRYAGLQVSWAIFDGFATRGAVASALASKRAAELEYTQFAERLAREAQSAARAVEFAQKELGISERQLNNAENFLAYTKTDFTRGQASEADVGSAQAGYNHVLGATNAARYKYLMRVAEFVSLIEADAVGSSTVEE
jgi:outer membrane protein TolC